MKVTTKIEGSSPDVFVEIVMEECKHLALRCQTCLREFDVTSEATLSDITAFNEHCAGCGK